VGRQDAVESSGTCFHTEPSGWFGNEWLFLIRPLRVGGSRAKGHELLTERGISLRSDASLGTHSAGQHACLARPSRLDLRGTPRAAGSRS